MIFFFSVAVGRVRVVWFTCGGWGVNLSCLVGWGLEEIFTAYSVVPSLICQDNAFCKYNLVYHHLINLLQTLFLHGGMVLMTILYGLVRSSRHTLPPCYLFLSYWELFLPDKL